MDPARNENQMTTSTPTEINRPKPEEHEEPGLLYRAFYGVGYYLSFGIMFPTMLVVRAIPLDNAFGDGLCDGTLAAKDSSAAVYVGMNRAANSVAHKAGDLYAGVSRRVQERVEMVQDGLAERRHQKQIASSESAAS